MKQQNQSIIQKYAHATIDELVMMLDTSLDGLSKEKVYAHRQVHKNAKFYYHDSIMIRIRRAFLNPFSIVLSFIAILSFVVDIVLQAPNKRNYMSFFIMITMLIVSGTIRFIQELKAKKVSDQSIQLFHQNIQVKRNGGWHSIDVDELVIGDYIRVSCGEQIPADTRIVSANTCYVSEAIITGESKLYEKTMMQTNVFDATIAYGGTSVVSGSLEGFVFAVGDDCLYGKVLFDHIQQKHGFDQGANSIAWVLIRFMVLLVPLVFIVSGIMKDDWFLSLLFSLSVAVGLTPELLPMVITACLTKGSYAMSKKQSVVKNVNAMQAFGNMDVLCVDKTGTLTSDTLFLEYYMDILGNEDSSVLEYAYINSFFQGGMKNHLDQAILDAKERSLSQEFYDLIETKYKKLDELPFDYARKFTTVLVEDDQQHVMIMKGNLEQVVSRCKQVMYRGHSYKMDDASMKSVYAVVDDMLEDGMKVLAIAIKDVNQESMEIQDEQDFTLVGYIAFFDAPKKSAKEALQQLKSLHIQVKVLTGDHSSVAKSICRRLDMDVSTVLSGEEFDALSEHEVLMRVEQTSIFSELTPIQKQKIVDILQTNGHVVGFLGDGLNDLPATLQADVGISVDQANASLKDASDVLLLKKDLKVLESGILEGRRAFANMSKYIKITASSNLGNIIAIVIASLCLPFFPMTSVQLLLLNLLYDSLCLILPWDFVDDDMLEKPLEWSGDKLSTFMLYFGPISSIFDIVTFCFLYWILCPMLSGGSFVTLEPSQQAYFISIFQTGWFLESMWTQILILYLLRTKHMPLVQSKPSKVVLWVTLLGIFTFTIVAMTPLGSYIGMTSLPLLYFLFLIVIVICYLTLITFVKKRYVARHDTLL